MTDFVVERVTLLNKATIVVKKSTIWATSGWETKIVEAKKLTRCHTTMAEGIATPGKRWRSVVRSIFGKTSYHRSLSYVPCGPGIGEPGDKSKPVRAARFANCVPDILAARVRLLNYSKVAGTRRAYEARKSVDFYADVGSTDRISGSTSQNAASVGGR